MIYTNTYIDGFTIISGSRSFHSAQLLAMLAGMYFIRDFEGSIDSHASTVYIGQILVHIFIPTVYLLDRFFNGLRLVPILQ